MTGSTTRLGAWTLTLQVEHTSPPRPSWARTVMVAVPGAARPALLQRLLGVYSDPARDPRGHTVSVVFVARSSGEPRAGDDAGRVLLADPAALPPLAFDHARILADYLASREHDH